ncbi:MAG: TerC family protein [Candidatus Hydrogenedentes bacterium]|nr:TerC family protein [Candidatus Hydrogenedentota bacterium]
MNGLFSIPDHFWVSLTQIIGIDMVLSGDNAVVIALAANSLPPRQQRMAVVWGAGAAVGMRVILATLAVALLSLPYLKLVGAALLLWIGVKLMLPEDDSKDVQSSENLIAAIKTIMLADAVMSLDNVVAVAAAAKGSVLLLALGLGISIPIVIFGSTILLKLMERFPVVITLGAALLGYVAGEMAVSDPAISQWIESHLPSLHRIVAVAGALAVVVAGRFLARRKAAEEPLPDEV